MTFVNVDSRSLLMKAAILYFSSSDVWIKSRVVFEISSPSLMTTLLMLYFSQFFSSIIWVIGVAGVIDLIEYGELGTL